MSDPIAAYEAAMEGLKAEPESLEFRRLAVLALARAGSTEFAEAEYARYGLRGIRRDEDVMALAGRLSKDLCLRAAASGDQDAARRYAQTSAGQYEAAYQDTASNGGLGYYSGINSATMAMMADMPQDIYRGRANSILERLPALSDQAPEDLYYIEATRAEAHLLLGDIWNAQEALTRAVRHDPLNYGAHATTLKQFKMALDKLGQETRWLTAFTPPRAAHFAGHIFTQADSPQAVASQLSLAQVEDLQIQIQDVIQREDIGFGYGALAAGSDILFAEALIEEGADLHVILPCSPDTFRQHSVAPFGSDWEPRFEHCLSRATSVACLTEDGAWPNLGLNQFSGRVAMGQTLMRAATLSTNAVQCLIWDEVTGSYTADHAADWTSEERISHRIEFPGQRKAALPSQETSEPLRVILSCANDGAIIDLPDLNAACEQARAWLLETPDAKLGLDIGLKNDIDAVRLRAQNLSKQAAPHSLLVSDDAASLLTLQNAKAPSLLFAGIVAQSSGRDMRAHTLAL